MTQPTSSIVIAIDGPAASGKSTVGEKLAKRLGYFFFDTGVMYRAVTLAALNEFGQVGDEVLVSALSNRIQIDARSPSCDDGRTMDVLVEKKDVTWEIRTPQVDLHVSQVSAYEGVRTAMTEQQRRIGKRGDVVMVGRDIGTVVFPDARYKFFLDASPEERARRRYAEILERGESGSYQTILASIRRRDKIDSTRVIAPLKPAPNAMIIDTDGKTIEEVVEEIFSQLDIKLKNVG